MSGDLTEKAVAMNVLAMRIREAVEASIEARFATTSLTHGFRTNNREVEASVNAAWENLAHCLDGMALWP